MATKKATTETKKTETVTKTAAQPVKTTAKADSGSKNDDRKDCNRKSGKNSCKEDDTEEIRGKKRNQG